MADDNMKNDHEHDMDGKGDEMKGKVKETAGKMTGDRSTEAGGKMDQMKGKAKEMAGDIKDKTDD